jgi:FMN phosphatase YigB (HAD superfamily)
MQELGNDYHFFDYFGLNKNLLSKLAEMKNKIQIYMITEGKIQNYPELKEKLEVVFDYDKIYSTGQLGLDKKTPAAYEYVIKDLGIKPHEILFIDDSEENSKAARDAGLQVIQYESEFQTIKALQENFNNP